MSQRAKQEALSVIYTYKYTVYVIALLLAQGECNGTGMWEKERKETR
jgi:hypothetical protein